MNKKTLTRRAALGATLAAPLLAGALSLALPRAAHAQTYPDKPVRIVHGFAAGGNADAVARILGTDLARILGQQVLVEPKPGAGGTIAAGSVASAKPDGYTLLLATGGHAIAGALYDKLPYDTVRSFQPLASLTSFPFLVVTNAGNPATTLPELLQGAKSRNKQLNFGTAGIGTGQHLTGELLAQRSGGAMMHVPYRGESASITAILGNEVDFVVVAPTAAISHIKAGKLRALATSGGSRWNGLPDVKTVAEQGLAGFEVRSWTGLLAPAGTPKPVTDRLQAAIQQALKDEALVARLVEVTGGDVVAGGPQEFQRLIETDLKRWSQLVKEAKIQKD
ncbi:tripartite tricarboxylate transporter substrate binding protein [Ideonella margarita]|uniref:Tripartite tricarboxylate transporter substrate binding protein n=1 Tax=Ideonella margarita TaxID=2984191 RepID=A0ABU9C6I4_9BURK